jgi:hypothetical protein
MRIGAGTNIPYAAQRPGTTATDHSADTSFSASLTSAQPDSAEDGDFRSMTRADLRHWVNSQIQNGEMSLDDSEPFMAMTMNIPVGTESSGGELPAEGDGMRSDFTQKARDGMKGAVSRSDDTTLKMLESAMSIMLRQQG